MRDFRDLKVWHKAHALACRIYRESKQFPREESYGLTSQIRRAGMSIPANIAEGCGRDGDVELARFLTISMGSASELEYLVLLAKDLSYFDEDVGTELLNETAEVKRMLSGFILKLKRGR